MPGWSRKDFFKGIAIGTIGLPLAIRALVERPMAQHSNQPALNGRVYEWKMVTTWPPNFPVLGEGANILAKWVEEASGGRLRIKVFGGGELVPPLECFDAVRTGAADMASGAAYYWAGKAPATQFFASVPFGMNAQQLNAWFFGGGGWELWQEVYDRFNLFPIPGGNSGVQMGGWFNREINRIADLKGLKMRMPGLGGKVLERAGGATVLLAGGELYTGLERGVIDATEWIGPYHDYKMGFHQIAKYYYTPGWHEPGTALEFFVNKDRLNELPEDLRAILINCTLRMNHWVLNEFEAKNVIYLQKLIEEENVEVRTFPTPVLEELKRISEEVIGEITAKDEMSRKVYASYDAFRKKVKAWSDISERQYYEQLQ